MTDNNKIYDLPKTETISYFNETEWNKDLSVEEIVQREQLAELIYQDNLLNGAKVGPGNEQSRFAVKAGASVGIAVLTAVCPPAGIGLAAGTTGVGAFLTGVAVARENDCGSDEETEGLKTLGTELLQIGFGGAAGGIDNRAALTQHTKNGCPLPLTFCKK